MDSQFSRRRVQGDEWLITFPGVSREGFGWCGTFIDGVHRWSFAGRRRERTVELSVRCLNLGREEIAIVHIKLVDRRRNPPEAQCPRYAFAHPGQPCILQLPVAELQARGLLHQDCLAFSLGGYRVQRPPWNHSSLSLDLGRLLDSGEGSDVTFQIGGDEFMAHRAIVQAGSPALAAEFFSAPETHVRIGGGMDPKIFCAFLKFLYTDRLPRG